MWKHIDRSVGALTILFILFLGIITLLVLIAVGGMLVLHSLLVGWPAL
jgi:hypothetical protein